MNLEDLIRVAPSIDDSMDSFAEWLGFVGEFAKLKQDDSLNKLVDSADFFLSSKVRRDEHRAKILAYLKVMKGSSNYMGDKPAVFVVHGHDGSLKSEVARFLEKLGLEPVILHEQANRGQTIIEKLEAEISRVKYGIVLYTADDIVESGVKRARQNVVFEHGFLVGRLNRHHVCVIMDDDIEKPSDSDGLLYIPRNNWQLDVAKELRAVGFDIDMNLL